MEGTPSYLWGYRLSFVPLYRAFSHLSYFKGGGGWSQISGKGETGGNVKTRRSNGKVREAVGYYAVTYTYTGDCYFTSRF